MKAVGFSFSLKTARADENKTAMVVVLIPPAVEPGEPPVIINIIIIKTPASLSAVKSTVLKPAVLGVTDGKRNLKSAQTDSYHSTCLLKTPQNKNTKPAEESADL